MKKQIFGDAQISLYEYNNNIVIIDFIENWAGPTDIATAKKVVAGIKSTTASIEGSNALLGIIPKRYAEKRILNYYQQADFGEIARAFVIPSFAAKIVGNMYLKAFKNAVNENGRYVLTKLFTDKGKAVLWLQEQLDKNLA
jgi:hypothetical protein